MFKYETCGKVKIRKHKFNKYVIGDMVEKVTPLYHCNLNQIKIGKMVSDCNNKTYKLENIKILLGKGVVSNNSK